MNKKLANKQSYEQNRHFYDSYESNFPISWEINGITQILNQFRQVTEIPILLSDLSSAHLLYILRERKKKGVNINVFSGVASFRFFYGAEKI